MKQPRISAMEKPGGANYTLGTLKRLAEAFDVALIVRFAPSSELLDWSDKFSPDEFAVAAFPEEFPGLVRQVRNTKRTVFLPQRMAPPLRTQTPIPLYEKRA